MDRYQPQETALESRDPATRAEPETADRPLAGWPLASPGRGWLGSAVGPTPEERLARLVRTIEADIIPRLVRAHQPPPLPADHPATTAAARVRTVADLAPALDEHAFIALVLAADDATLYGRVDGLVAQGCSIESIYLDLIAPTARRLGVLWADDRCNFADVTIAAGRLQQMLRRLSPAFGRQVPVPQDGRHILLLPAPGEQHTLGLAMVADFFFRAGWQVTAGGALAQDGAGDPARCAADAVRRVRDDWFDVVGLSLGSRRGLAALTGLVGALRRSSRNRGLGILVGGPLFADEPALVAQTGADAMAASGTQAPEVAERLLALRASRIG